MQENLQSKVHTDGPFFSMNATKPFPCSLMNQFWLVTFFFSEAVREPRSEALVFTGLLEELRIVSPSRNRAEVKVSCLFMQIHNAMIYCDIRDCLKGIFTVTQTSNMNNC